MVKQRADLLLLVVAIFWGLGYIGTDILISSNMNSIALVGYRFFIASLVLIVIFLKKLKFNKDYIWGSLIVGFVLFLAFLVQTVAMEHTSVTNVSFFTGTNVVFIPFLSFLLNKKSLKINHLFAIFLTVMGIWFLTGGIKNVNFGDILALACAFLFALHIVLISYYSKSIEIYNLAIYQMLFVSIFAFILSLFLNINLIEEVQKVNIGVLIFVGLIPSALCFLLQNIGLKYVDESKGSIILNTESLWGAIFAIIILSEPFEIAIVIGGLLMFSAVLLDEISISKLLSKE